MNTKGNTRPLLHSTNHHPVNNSCIHSMNHHPVNNSCICSTNYHLANDSCIRSTNHHLVHDSCIHSTNHHPANDLCICSTNHHLVHDSWISLRNHDSIAEGMLVIALFKVVVYFAQLIGYCRWSTEREMVYTHWTSHISLINDTLIHHRILILRRFPLWVGLNYMLQQQHQRLLLQLCQYHIECLQPLPSVTPPPPWPPPLKWEVVKQENMWMRRWKLHLQVSSDYHTIFFYENCWFMLYEVDTIDICTTYSITVSLSLLPIPNTNLVHSFHCCHKQLLVRLSTSAAVSAAVAVAVETTTTITVATWYILLHIWMTMMINIMKVQCNNGCSCSSNIMNNTNNIHRGNTCTTQLSLQSSLRKEQRTSLSARIHYITYWKKPTWIRLVLYAGGRPAPSSWMSIEVRVELAPLGSDVMEGGAPPSRSNWELQLHYWMRMDIEQGWVSCQQEWCTLF